MRKTAVLIWLLLLTISWTFCYAEPVLVVQKKFIIYDERPKGNINGYFPYGFMGDASAVACQYNWKDNPHSGSYCQRWTYTVKDTANSGWAGVYWQNPASNWGDIDGGFNLSNFTKLTFWARGEKGDEVISFKMGGIRGTQFADTALVELPYVALTQEWKQYVIDLQGEDLSRIMGGFCWVVEKIRNPNGCIFYLDDIQYE